MSKCLLGDIAVSQTGPFGSQLHEADYVEQGTPIVTVEHLGEIGFTTQNLPFVSQEDTERLSKFLLKEGDIVFSRVGSIDRSVYVKKEQEGWLFSGRCLRVRCDKKKVNPRYLSYYFKLADFKKMMLNISVGATMPSLNTSLMDNIPLNIPERKIQDKIAILLDAIDTKIENNNKINTELEAMTKTIYDYWFLQFEFPNEEGKPYKSSGGKMVWNEELKKEIPYNWKSGTLEEVGDIVAGGTPSTKHSEYYVKKGIAWITPNDMSNTTDKYITHGERDVSEIGLNSSSAQLMPKGTVLLTSRAPIGYIGIAANELCTNQGFKSIVPNGEYGSEFIYYTVRKMVPYLKSLGTGSTFTEISKNVVAKVKIIIPEKEVVKKFEGIIFEMSARRKNIEAENKELISLRDFLLPLLMNGQIGFKD